jgi:hypothetical protein
MSSNPRLEALKMQIRALEGQAFGPSGAAILAFADPLLNAPLPHGGLGLGALHEFYATGMEAELAAAPAGFAATIAAAMIARHGGCVVWAVTRADCYIGGLSRFGLDPSRVVWAECRKDADVAGIMEEALSSGTVAAVLGEAGPLSLKTGRRLSAAARASGSTALLIRRQFSRPSRSAHAESGAAATRWRVCAVPALEGVADMGMGAPRWRLDLEYCRNGRTAAWIVEAADGYDGGKAGDVRVVAELRHGACQVDNACSRDGARTVRSS